MTRKFLATSLILLVLIAAMFAIIVSFTPTNAYADGTYTITWVNGTETLEVDEDVAAGATPTYDGATPTKASDAQYTYAFSGWSPEIYTVDKDQTYTAQFTPTLRSYQIIWKNGETPLETDNDVPYGETPEYNGATPTKDPDVRYTYTFSGWSPEVSSVVGDQIYSAQFNEEYILYTITWKDYDDSPLAELDDATYDTVYPYADPERDEDMGHTYAFNDWDEVVDSGNQTIVRTATYTTTPKYYKARYENWNGDVLYSIDSDTEYDLISYVGETPTRAADAQYTYAFNTWSEDLQGDTLVYTATYSTTTNQYTITFMNGSDVLQSGLVNYGDTPTYTGETPTKPDEGGRHYLFAGWDPDVAAVTGDQTYEAQFSTSPIIYKVTYGSGEEDFINVVYGTSYNLPVLTQEGKWLTEWKYLTTVIANHDGASLAVYSYESDITVTPTWVDFEIDINTHFVSIENKTQETYQLEVVATGDITYTSSDEKVFTVSQTGLVTCVSKGRAIITVQQTGGGTSDTCVFVSVDKIIDNVNYILNITINEGINNQSYVVLCNDKSTIEYVSDAFLLYKEISNEYVDRTDLGIEIDKSHKVSEAFSKDSSTLNINLMYSVFKAENPAATYSLSKTLAEYKSQVQILDLVANDDYVLGNVIAFTSSDSITVQQSDKTFTMPAANVITDVLLKEVPVKTSTIKKIEIKTNTGIEAGVTVTVDLKASDNYNSKIQLLPNKESVSVINVSFKKGDAEVDNVGEYTLKFSVPQELLGRDGIEVFYIKDGETKTQQVIFDGNEITITLTGVGDIVFAANVHESTTYLYWLIIMLLFFDSFLGMIIVILATNYTDALARRKALNGYSVVLSPIVLLGAIVAKEIAAVAFLGLVFVIEIIAIAWLSLKLTNRYFIYSTYHKLYIQKEDDED